MKVIIAGSRTMEEYHSFKIAEAHALWICTHGPIKEVVCGMANGADALGRSYAMDKGIHVREFPANWKKHHKAAGIIRNILMAEYADGLIIFIYSGSPGSEHMLRMMVQRNKPFIVYRDGKLI